MRMITLAAAGLLLAVTGMPVVAMSGYQWKFRPLLVFAPDAASADLVAQRAIVTARKSGYAERDVVVIWVVGETTAADFGPKPRESAAALRKQFGVPAGAFKAILVGKDGGSKLSSSKPLDAARIFSTIDAMPMRRDEARRR